MRIIDLRSDTVTRPTPAMRRAMADAEVGDDVYGEDPTVNRLQEMAAERLGKEAALFVPSGTMANQAAIRASTSHGDQVIATEGAHILRYESGAAAAISGVQIRTAGSNGMLSPEDVHASVPPKDAHNAPATLLALEITHNAAGGSIPSYEAVSAVVDAAREHGLRTHLDGARLFNAEVASGIAAREWARPFDTVSFCLSKGLGAPVGSLVCSTRETIERVHRVRKMLGGGMRQAGILAAAGIHALEQHVARLREDHANARRLADALLAQGMRVRAPETNIVLVDVSDAATFVREARRRGVLVGMAGPKRVRALTHLDVEAADAEEAAARLRDLAEERT